MTEFAFDTVTPVHDDRRIAKSCSGVDEGRIAKESVLQLSRSGREYLNGLHEVMREKCK